MIALKLTESEQHARDMRKGLMERAKQGDQEAKTDLMKLHGMRVYTPAEIQAFERL